MERLTQLFRVVSFVISVLAFGTRECQALLLGSEARSALHHFVDAVTWPRPHDNTYAVDNDEVKQGRSLLVTALQSKVTVQDLANCHIPRRDGGTILAYQAIPDKNGNNNNNDTSKLILLLHEFFGLSQSICDKADALANDLGCTVIAPDTFRGESSTFIPKCIWLALSTPQERVNNDLNDVVEWYQSRHTSEEKLLRLAVMGFCYGGGKAIRYTTQCQPTAATVICYGSPVVDVDALAKLQKPVCGVFGKDDFQFPPSVLEQFELALQNAKVTDYDLVVYEGVGHAFWKDMDQVRRRKQPQYDAYQQVVRFLKRHL